MMGDTFPEISSFTSNPYRHSQEHTMLLSIQPIPSRPGQPYPKQFHPSCPRYTRPYEHFTARKPLSALCVERTHCPILYLVAEDMVTPFILSTCRFGPSGHHDPSRARKFLEYFNEERDGVGEYRIRIFGRNAPPLLFGGRWTWTR